MPKLMPEKLGVHTGQESDALVVSALMDESVRKVPAEEASAAEIERMGKTESVRETLKAGYIGAPPRQRTPFLPVGVWSDVPG